MDFNLHNWAILVVLVVWFVGAVGLLVLQSRKINAEHKEDMDELRLNHKEDMEELRLEYAESVETLREELTPKPLGLEVAEALDRVFGGNPDKFVGAVELYRLLGLPYTAPGEALEELDRATLAEADARAWMEQEHARVGVVGALFKALPPTSPAAPVVPNVNDDTVVNVKPATDAPES